MRAKRPTPVPRRRILPADVHPHVSSPFPSRWIVKLSCGHEAHVRNRLAKTTGCWACARVEKKKQELKDWLEDVELLEQSPPYCHDAPWRFYVHFGSAVLGGGETAEEAWNNAYENESVYRRQRHERD